MAIKAAPQARTMRTKGSAAPTPDRLASRPFAPPKVRAREPRKTAPAEPANVAARPSFSFSNLVLQPKLTVGRPDDPFEREADRVADEVMRMPDPEVSVAAARPQISRKCEACGDEEANELQTKQDRTSVSHAEAPESVYEVLQSTGQPLDAGTRAFMEPRFGQDFSDVRVHPEATASKSTRAVNALAYTVGRDVVFAPGTYAPNSSEGRRLLAHELAHVVQQSGGGVGTSVDGGVKVVQRYGQASSCTDKDHLIPYIWPGHPKAKELVQKAIDATDGRPLTDQVTILLHTYFGSKSTETTNLAQINADFKKISSALDSAFYHCSKRGDSSDKDAITCKGQSAETSSTGIHAITLCFDNLDDWNQTLWTPWLIIHENVHRGLNVFGPGAHSWDAGSLGGCSSNRNVSQASPLDLGNPDSYACFAVLQ